MWAGPPDYSGVCDVDDPAFALIKFACGMTLELNVTWAGNFPNDVLPESMVGVFGDQAGVTFELFGEHFMVAKESEGKNVDQRIEVSPSDLFSEQMIDFVSAVKTREVRGATADQGTMIQALIESIYQSSAQGKAVTF